MFAGAVREAVFGSPAVIRKVNAEFIPVSVGAGRLHRQAPDDEGRILYAAGRSAPRPQGIAVMNADGQVLEWVLGFQSDAKVIEFLDHARERFRQNPDGARPFGIHGYMAYPGQQTAETPAPEPVRFAARHPQDSLCPAERAQPEGTIEVQVFGRALDAQGRPLVQNVNQEHYAQDRFSVAPERQAEVARLVRAAGTEAVKLPESFTRECVSHAYLGQLDVNPLNNPLGASSQVRELELRARQVSEAGGILLARVEGRSDAESGTERGGGFRHRVTLEWDGFLEFKGDRIARLTLSARGRESLRWGLPPARMFADGVPLVSRLMAGRSLDFEGGVRYGLIGDPHAGPAADAAAADAAPGPAPDGPPLHALLGSPFVVALPAVQDDLKLAPAQRDSLRLLADDLVGQAHQHLPRGTQPDPEMLRGFMEYRQRAERRLRELQAKEFSPEQVRRLREIELQLQGPFALLGDAGEALGLTREQRQGLARIAQELGGRLAEAQRRAAASGGPQTVPAELARERRAQEQRALDLLTEEQRARWKAMLGKPLPLPAGF